MYSKETSNCWLDCELAFDKFCLEPNEENWKDYQKTKARLKSADNADKLKTQKETKK